MSVPLAELFSESLRTSVFPDCLKKALVLPIFKSGGLSLEIIDRYFPGNYRPISLLLTACQVFERIIFKHFFKYLNSTNLLTPLQSGFIPGDSTINKLIHLYNFFFVAIDSGKEVRAVFCDVSKAFYRVWHKGLLFKLVKCMGINNKLLSWFSSYLYCLK